MGWLSTDTIRGVVNLHFPLYDPDAIFEPHGPEADRFFPAFSSVASSCHDIADDYLVEGVGFYPRHVDQLSGHIERRVVFVGQSKVDLSDILEHEGRNLWHRGLDEDALARLPGWIESWSRELEAECAALGYPYVDLAAGDFAVQYGEVAARLFGEGAA